MLQAVREQEVKNSLAMDTPKLLNWAHFHLLISQNVEMITSVKEVCAVQWQPRDLQRLDNVKDMLAQRPPSPAETGVQNTTLVLQHAKELVCYVH